MSYTEKNKGVFPPHFEQGFRIIYKPFSRKDVQKAMSALGLTTEKARKMTDCFEAAVHLYGMLSLQEMHELLTAYHLDLDPDVLAEAADLCNHCIQNDYYFVDRSHIDSGHKEPDKTKWWFVSRYLVQSPEWYSALRKDSAGKQTTVLPKKEFLRYKDSHYFESTPESRLLMDLLKKHTDFSEQKRNRLLAITNAFIRAGGSCHQVLDQFNAVIHPKDHASRQALADAVTAYYNDTRMWSNRGKAPLQALLYEIEEDDVSLDIHESDMDHRSYTRGVRDAFEKQLHAQGIHPSLIAGILNQLDERDAAHSIL